MDTGIAKKIYLIALCIGLALAIIGGVMLTVREMEHSSNVTSDGVKINVEQLPDGANTKGGASVHE